jgi:prevent-host-death family protein
MEHANITSVQSLSRTRLKGVGTSERYSQRIGFINSRGGRLWDHPSSQLELGVGRNYFLPDFVRRSKTCMSQVQPLPIVGVRELRQDASSILRGVKTGETFEITEHGKPVAQIGPIQSSIVETWITRNLITPAKAPG